jgi:pilus assembly protein Flp/PilA
VTNSKTAIAPKRASLLAHLREDEAGQDLVEYALIAGFIGCGTVLGVHGLAAQVSSFINTVTNGFNADIASGV